MKIEIESRFSIFGNVSGFFRSGVETSLIKIGNMCSLKGFRDSHSSLSGAKQALPVLQNNFVTWFTHLPLLPQSTTGNFFIMDKKRKEREQNPFWLRFSLPHRARVRTEPTFGICLNRFAKLEHSFQFNISYQTELNRSQQCGLVSQAVGQLLVTLLTDYRKGLVLAGAGFKQD